MDVCGFTPTNSLASASFDVLNISGVEDPLINVNRLASTDFEESYFASAIAHINETRNGYTNAKIVLYKAISEAQTQQVVLESFSDFFIKVREIIEKFLQFIKKMFARFLTNLNKLIGSETYLKKHKKDFDDFKSSDEAILQYILAYLLLCSYHLLNLQSTFQVLSSKIQQHVLQY